MPPKAAARTSTRTKVAAVPTTTRTTRAAAKAAEPAPTAAPAAKKTTRKPLTNRVNAEDATQAATKPAPAKPPSKSRTLVKTNSQINQATCENDDDREPIMAFLRIRPNTTNDASVSQPYLAHLNNTSVRMTDPNGNAQSNSRFRISTVPPSSIYTFSHIFPPATTQSDFFTKTTLPIVRDALNGQSGLLFTYGVTNSGKTFTIQGGSEEGSAGILPRTVDVIFNSIDGLHADGKYRPVRLHGIEAAEPSDSRPPRVVPVAAVQQVLDQTIEDVSSDTDVDSTAIQLDRNYEYSIWLSYAEVYNEKIYDLLDTADNSGSQTSIPRSTSNPSLLLMRKALNLRPSPTDDTGSDVPGKYVSGLKQFRVHNASEAKALVKMGQLHRRVFGTLANRESSRSHGIVTLKIIRGHRGERNDPTALQVSRLTLVDLAGSERTKHTQTTGDRLKEAGNINKSLMVLGQCMEVMRSNQRRLAASLAHEGVGLEGRMDTRDVKKGLAIVPFRHSKLTELLMDYFTGNGRVVMIVNVNPYDTGYDENSHVMKFAALAREVYVTPAPAPMQRAPLANSKVSDVPRPSQTTRKVTIDNGGPGRKSAVLTVLEEEEPDEGYSNDSELANPLVDALFDEIESLHVQLFECELKCAVIEAETREEVMKEMEERMRQMEKMYARRLMNEVERNEMKTDAKIEFLHQSGLFNSPTKRPQPVLEESEDEISHIIEELDVEMDLVASGEELVEEGSSVSGHSRSPSPSIRPKAKHSSNVPPAQIRRSMGRTEVVHHVPQGPTAVKLPSDEEEESQLSETEDDDTEADEIEDEADDSGGDEEVESDDEDWQPDVPAKGHKTTRKSTSSSTSKPQSSTKGKKAGRISYIDEEMESLSLKEADEDDDDDIMDEDEEVQKPKPKRRILGKKPIVTEDQIEKAVGRVQLQASRSSGVRRSTRG